MSRISLVEAYDNRDVIGQLVKLRQDVQQLYDIVENIDPSGDLTNFVTKTGDETIDGIKTFIGKIVADCDIIQNGATYETHAEQVFSKDDYIVMRDGAIAGLSSGDCSGLEVKLYNGVDDARLAVDDQGVARVGDVGDEQPLLTRDEAADMTSGNILSWDGVNQKAITSGKSVSDLSDDISAVSAAKVSGSGNIGDDTKPVKIVGGVATAVTTPLLSKLATARCQAVSNNVTANTITAMTFSMNLTSDANTLTVNNGVVTTKKAGMHMLIMSISGSVSTATRLELALKRDGSSEYQYAVREVVTTGTNQTVEAIMLINETSANHTYQMEVWSSASAVVTSNAGTATHFDVIYLG